MADQGLESQPKKFGSDILLAVRPRCVTLGGIRVG